MSIFEEVSLSWQGKEYIVSPDKVMGLVAVIEDVITIEEMSGKGVKRAKLAGAFAAAIRYAARCNGVFVKVSDEEVYASLFGADFHATTTRLVETLITLIIPPEHLRLKTAEEGQAPEKQRAPRQKAK